ncbi:hypothetical protein C8Q74DRAFT_1315127 [Fomes fomentarius]|nr:hypothetical protein C8Q74DRAFT_1315127 [Fomes fomentarius]
MATDTNPAPRDVQTTLNYLKPLDDQPPMQYVGTTVHGETKTNVGVDPRQAVVHDIRGREAEFNLNTHGFQFLRWPSVEREFVDEDAIKSKYYSEVETILKQATGAKRVHIFDHTIRRNQGSKDQTESDPKNRGPADRVHVDQTYESAPERVKHHLPDEAERLLKSRNPVAYKPLAVADWRTLDQNDLVPVKLIYPDRTGALFSVFLIKCYDSDEDRARSTPHSAFTDAGSPKEGPHRQSLEVRALVFDAEQSSELSPNLTSHHSSAASTISMYL